MELCEKDLLALRRWQFFGGIIKNLSCSENFARQFEKHFRKTIQ